MSGADYRGPETEIFVHQSGDSHAMSIRPCNARARLLTTVVFASSAVVMVLSFTLTEASAKTTVDGEPTAVSLTADDAPISEVLTALSAKFDLVYTPTPGLDRTIGGNYSGTLQQVLERILDGCDYVVSYSDDKIELRVIGRSSSTARPQNIPSSPQLAIPGPAANARPSVR